MSIFVTTCGSAMGVSEYKRQQAEAEREALEGAELREVAEGW